MLTEGKTSLKESEAKRQFDVDASDNDAIEERINTLEEDAPSLYETSNALKSQSVSVTKAVEAKQKAEEEARIAAEKAKKKQAAGSIAFAELFRAGESLKGEFYKFEGKVIQDTGQGSFRVSITADQGYSRVFWTDPIMLKIQGKTAEKIIEDDIISFTAQSDGLFQYRSVLGATIELPAVIAEGADVKITGRDD